LRRTLRTSLLAVPAAFGLAVATSTSANAHYVYYADLIWSNADSSRCLMSRSETSHGSGGGYFRGDASSQAEISALPTDCILNWERNTRHLAEQYAIMKWYVDANGDGSWLTCYRTDQWYFNNEPASVLRLISSNVPAGGECGAGYYGLYNFANMVDSGSWVGTASMWSGTHLLPDNSLAPAPPAPPIPEWVEPNGVADFTEMPAKFQVADKFGAPLVGPDGKPVEVNLVPEAPNSSNGTATGGERHVETLDNGAVVEVVTPELERVTR
jgi:hypothetical protein